MQFYRYITINLTPVFIKSWIDHTSPFRCSATRPCECGAATVATANLCRGRVGDRRPPDYRRAPAARGLSRFLFVPLRGGAHHHLTSPPVAVAIPRTMRGIDYSRLAGGRWRRRRQQQPKKSIPKYALLQRFIRRLGFVPARWLLIKAEGVGARRRIGDELRGSGGGGAQGAPREEGERGLQRRAGARLPDNHRGGLLPPPPQLARHAQGHPHASW